MRYAVPLYNGAALVRLQSGAYQAATVIGLDDTSLYGRPQVIEDTDEVLKVLADLAGIYEGKDGWSLDALPPGNAAVQTKGIVAFRMVLDRVESKTKLSQNRDLEDRHRVIAKLEASEGDDAKATAAWRKRVLP